MHHSPRPGAPVVFSALLVLAQLTAAAPGQVSRQSDASRSLADFAPAEAFAYVSFAGIDASSKAAETLGIYRIWKEPETQEFFKQAMAIYQRASATAPEQMLEHWKAGKEMFSGRIELVVGGIDIAWARGTPMPIPGAVLAVEMTGEPKHWKQHLMGFIGQMQGKWGDTVARGSFQHAGHEVTTFRVTPGWGQPAFTLCLAFAGNRCLVGLNQSLIKRCLTNHAEGHAGLAALPAFQRARAKAGENLFEVFLNIEAVKSRVRGLVPDPWLEAVHETGLDAINAVYFASAAKDGDTFDTLYLDAPAPRRGFLDLAGNETVNASNLRWIPDSAVMAVTARIDLMRAWDTAWRAAALALPAETLARAQGQVQREMKQLGIDLRDDILATLGTEFSAYAEMPRDGAIPKLVACIGIRDAKKAQGLVQKGLSMANDHVTSWEFEGHRMATFRIQGDIPLTPTMCLSGDRLWLASSVAAMKDVIRREQNTEKSLVDGANFKRAFEGLPWNGASMLSYVDVRRLARFGYDACEEFLPGLIERFQLPLDAFAVPSSETVLKHINSFGSVGFGDEHGLVIQARSLGLATVLALASRFLDQASGCPPHAVSEIIQQARSGQRGRMARATPIRPNIARPLDRRGERLVPEAPTAGEPIREAKVPEAPKARHAQEPPRAETEESPAGPQRIINPVREGDPKELQLRERIASLTEELQADPDDDELYFQRGLARHNIREFKPAARDFEIAWEKGMTTGTCAYNAACCLALAKDSDAALVWLKRAFDRRFNSWDHIDRDSDLDSLRNDPRFQELVRKHKKSQPDR